MQSKADASDSGLTKRGEKLIFLTCVLEVHDTIKSSHAVSFVPMYVNEILFIVWHHYPAL